MASPASIVGISFARGIGRALAPGGQLSGASHQQALVSRLGRITSFALIWADVNWPTGAFPCLIRNVQTALRSSVNVIYALAQGECQHPALTWAGIAFWEMSELHRGNDQSPKCLISKCKCSLISRMGDIRLRVPDRAARLVSHRLSR